MPLSGLRLTEVSASDLEALIENSVREDRRIEYKRLIGTDDEAKRKFLAAVSSFANASGGDLLIGVEEEDGAAGALEGLDDATLDDEQLRLSSLIRDGIEPRITGIEMEAVSVQDGRSVLVVRIPRSWAAPHMVKFKGASRFYSRTSNGKHQLDVMEIRAAFVASDVTGERLRKYRRKRLARIVADDLVVMASGAKLVLHLMPYGMFDLANQVETVELHFRGEHANLLQPLYSETVSTRINFEGAIARSPGDGPAETYSQAFRSGSIESVDMRLLDPFVSERIPAGALENVLIAGLCNNLAVADALGVQLPVVVGVSLLGVKGRSLAGPQALLDRPDPFERNDLILPEVVVEKHDVDHAAFLRPIFDMIWNAAGRRRSPYYDEDGNRIEGP